MAKEWEHLLNFRCTTCGDCCREPIVLVTDTDVRRVMAHTGKSADEIADFYGPDEIEWGRENEGWIRLDVGWRILGLVRTEEGCQFLQEDNLCGIYEHRPVTCRRYPFDVEFDEEKLTLLEINDSVDCPYELDGKYDPKDIKALVDWEEEEEGPYFKQVRAWNKIKPAGDRAAFFKHLGL